MSVKDFESGVSVAIRTAHGTFLSARQSKTIEHSLPFTKTEIFQVVLISESKIALLTHAGTYVRARATTGSGPSIVQVRLILYDFCLKSEIL
jgi:hypothetical protein